LAIGRAVALRGEFGGALLHLLGEHLRLGEIVDQAPFLGTLGADAFGQGAEDVGVVAAHAALVGDAGEAAGAGQHAEQWNFGQADRRRAVIDEDDLVASQRQLVAATGGGAVTGGEELEAGMAAGILDAVARLVGEFAEIHLPGVGRQAEHEDVGAGAEDPVLAAGDDHAAYFGMLEADALQGVVQLDVDAEVIGIQLQLVAGLDATVFVDVEVQGGDLAVERQAPVLVLVGMGVVSDGLPGGIGTFHGILRCGLFLCGCFRGWG
jgi:hypothetical protein